MQTFATIKKQCKNGQVSTWHFIQTPSGEYAAFGGIRKQMKSFPSKEEAYKCFMSYLAYGYSREEESMQLELSLLAWHK